MRNALTYLLWPFVTGRDLRHLLGLAAVPVPVVFFAVGAGMLACVLAAEQLIPGARLERARRSPEHQRPGTRAGHEPARERVGELVFLTLAASAAGGLRALSGLTVPAHWCRSPRSASRSSSATARLLGASLQHTVPACGDSRPPSRDHTAAPLKLPGSTRSTCSRVRARLRAARHPGAPLGIFWYTSFIGILGVIAIQHACRCRRRLTGS